MTVTDFAYAQTRLQARHGQRPDERLWRRLQGAGELNHYLQLARRSPLQRWVEGMQPQQGSHHIELSLRGQLRSYVDEVAEWLPGPWRASMRWLRQLPDLAAIQHLLSQQGVPDWLLDDPVLAPLAAAAPSERRKALHGADGACLAQHWKPGVPVYRTWLRCWEKTWPAAPRLAAGLRRLAALEAEQAVSGLAGVADVSGRQRAALQQRYELAFRRYAFQPAAAFAHIALVTLDVQRLRGAILRRLLFDEAEEAVS